MGSSKSSAPAPVDPVKSAQQQLQAQLATLPDAAKIQHDINLNPEFGLQAQTQLARDAARNVFTGQASIEDQLIQNILGQLQSPTGLTSEQQGAVDARRGLAQNELVDAIRTRQNLGGNLFGGRGQNFEATQVGNLQNQFVEEDINRQERNRLNTQQIALTLLQALFPNVQLQQPQFINPVASGDNVFGGQIQQSNLAANINEQRQASKDALLGSLFQGIGNAAGSL